MKLTELVTEMRSKGVKRLHFVRDTFSPDLPHYEGVDGKSVAIEQIELSDTIPAPPLFEPDDTPTRNDLPKPASQCPAVGCAEQGGFFGTPYCQAHGLAAAGVKP